MRSSLALPIALVTAQLCMPAAAIPPAPQQRSPTPLLAELGNPGVVRAAQLTRDAMIHQHEAERQLQGDWRSVCRRTMSYRLSSESGAAVRGRMRALRQLLEQAMRRRAFFDNALARLRRAVELNPDSPETLFRLAEVLQQWEEPGPLWECTSRRRDDEAIGVLLRLRREHPQFRAEDVSFRLGVLFTRTRAFERARKAYAESIALALDQDETPVVRSNLAEVTMLSGDLQQALAHYERALQLSHGGSGYLLTLWGMSVALDRLGEHDQAIEQVGKALAIDSDRMRILRSDNVFFEPEYEVHYYEALGHEALARRDDTDRGRALTSAIESYQSYLTGAGPDGMFTPAANANLEQVRDELTELGGSDR